MLDKEDILFEIRRLAEANGGKPLGRNRFRTETGIKSSDWLGRYWVKWSQAIEEAGYAPNELATRADDDDGLRQLALETRRRGHLPTHAEMRMRRQSDPDFPGRGLYDRLGPKKVRAARLASFCADRPEFSDVLGLLAQQSEENGPQESHTEPFAQAAPSATDGYVYLLKSGRNYKIGRTNSVGRREYELAIQLPDPAKKVHIIKTDDPVGIERYWHERFAERHVHGEWFRLTAADVSAFKRRARFM